LALHTPLLERSKPGIEDLTPLNSMNIQKCLDLYLVKLYSYSSTNMINMKRGGGNPNARSLSAFLVIVTARFWLFICVLGYIPNFTKNYCFHHLVDYLSKEKSYERDLLLTAFSKRLQQAVNESSFAKQEQGVCLYNLAFLVKLCVNGSRVKPCLRKHVYLQLQTY